MTTCGKMDTSIPACVRDFSYSTDVEENDECTEAESRSVMSDGCPGNQQSGPDRELNTAGVQCSGRTKWTKKMNIDVMECYYMSKPYDDAGKAVRGYRARMHGFWKEKGYNTTEQRLCGQVRSIQKNNLLGNVKLDNIRRRVSDNSNQLVENQNEASSAENDVNQDVNRDGDRVDVRRGMCLRRDDVSADDEELVKNKIPKQLEDRVLEIQEVRKRTRRLDKQAYRYDFKGIDRNRLKKETCKVNEVLKYVETCDISGTNELIKAGSIVVAEKLKLKNLAEESGQREGQKIFQEPWWKRRIQKDIRVLRGSISVLDRKKRGELKNDAKYEELKKKYNIRNMNRLNVVIEELKQRVVAKKVKVKRYDQRIRQYRQNRLFSNDQKKFYQQLNGAERKERVIPDASESVKFWNGIWGKEKRFNKEADWLIDINEEKSDKEQEEMRITEDCVTRQCKRIQNWKTPGLDGVQGYWIKNFTTCHSRIACQLNDILNGVKECPDWLTFGKTVLCLKDPKKGNAVENFRPITCLPIMWKLMTGIIAESLYEYVAENNVLPEEQKGCRKGSKGTKDQLLIDKFVMKDSKRRQTNLTMAWIDYKKAYDMVPHMWIMECLKIIGCAKNVYKFIEKSMKQWRCRLMSCGEILGDVHIRRGIFQGDSLSPLLFVLCLIPLTLVLRKMKEGYEMKGKKVKINHLLFMDDLKLFGRNDAQIDSLVETVHCVSNDVGMEFGIKKCGVVSVRRGKISKHEGIILPNGEVMKQIEQDGYKYLGILEMEKIMEEEMKMKVKKEYLRRLKLVLKSKLNGRNKIYAINTWAVALIRYGGGVLDWRKNELQMLDRKTRKTMTIYGALHPKSDVDRLYLKRKYGGRGLIGCESCVRAEENNLGWYVKHSIEPLLSEVRRGQVIETEECIRKEDYKKMEIMRRKENWIDKKMYGQYYREMNEKIDIEKSWSWLCKSDLKPETEALICAAQEQALRTNYIKCKIDGTAESPLCRVCGEKGESVSHVVSECKMLAQKEYKRRHDNVARIIHWELCGKYKLDRAEKWYEHKPEGAVESSDVKLLWDFMIQCDRVVECRKPDIVIVDKKERKCVIIDVAIPGDSRVNSKEEEKIEKYQNLKQEIIKMWGMRKVEIIPIVIGALGAISKKFTNWIKKLEISIKVEHMQKTSLLGTARILRKVLNN